MNHCAFPAEFKTECLKEIIATIRAGDLSRNKVLELTQHIACFMGSGAELLKGDPIDPIGSHRNAQELVSKADELEKLVLQSHGNAQAVPWVQILQILIPILLDLFTDED